MSYYYYYGYTKITDITASDIVGKMFTGLLFLVTVYGAQISSQLKVEPKRIVHMVEASQYLPVVFSLLFALTVIADLLLSLLLVLLSF